MTLVYRVQDKDGRGPFKPGFTLEWLEDREDLDNLPTILTHWSQIAPKILKGYHLGCACSSVEALRRWFTQSEYQTLQKHGYKAVGLNPGIIILETDTQIVFQRKLPITQALTDVELY